MLLLLPVLVLVVVQGKVNSLLEQLFGIKTGFIGMLGSNVAKLKLGSVASMSNEKHMKPWGSLCREQGILNTPLSPFLDKELLAHNHTYVDGTAITTTGFDYVHPELTVELLREELELAILAKHFPPILVEVEA